MTRRELEDQISDLCEQAGCSEKIQKIHKAQYVDRRWNPHPPQTFCDWWFSVGGKQTEKRTGRAWVGIDAIRAFNCEAVRETYRESKKFGIQAEPVPESKQFPT